MWFFLSAFCAHCDQISFFTGTLQSWWVGGKVVVLLSVNPNMAGGGSPQVTLLYSLYLLLPTRETSSTTVGNNRSDKLLWQAGTELSDGTPAYCFLPLGWLFYFIFTTHWTQCTDCVYTWLTLLMQFCWSLTFCERPNNCPRSCVIDLSGC